MNPSPSTTPTTSTPAAVPSASPWGSAMRRVLAQPAFLTVAIVLLVAAVSLNGATEFLQLHFKKQPVELRKRLVELPAQLGPWVQVTADAPITHEIEEALGTKNYMFRFYVDTRRIRPDVVEEFKDKDSEKQREMVAMLQARDPLAVIYSAVTYYTGMVDTVAHIPDRCYVADGYEPTHYELKRWSAFAGRPGDGQARYINFEDRTPSRKSVMKNVGYVFHSNGEYVSDPLGVRKKLQNLLETHGYYAKVELLMVTDEREAASEQMNSFLTSALPELEECLPDWEQVKAAAASKPAGDNSK